MSINRLINTQFSFSTAVGLFNSAINLFFGFCE